MAAPVILFGAWCLHGRVSAFWAGLGSYFVWIAVICCWSSNVWLGLAATLVAVLLVAGVGSAAWRANFARPMIRYGRVLTTIFGALAIIGVVVPIMNHPRFEGRQPSVVIDDPAMWWWNGPGTAVVEVISAADRLPRTTHFQARLMAKWRHTEGTATVQMWVTFADGSRYLSRKQVFSGGEGGTRSTDSQGRSSGSVEIVLPFDASAATSAVQSISIEVILPGPGVIQVYQPIVIEDLGPGQVEKPESHVLQR